MEPIRIAVLECSAAGIRTTDLGGSASTTEFTQATFGRVAAKLEAWNSLGSS